MTGNDKESVVTLDEALRVLGIKKSSLHYLERAAQVPYIPDRAGYSDREFKSLLSTLRRILGRGE